MDEDRKNKGTENVMDIIQAELPTIAAAKRTADKMSLRAEYQDALSDNGLTLDYIAGGIKQICDRGSDQIRLRAFKMLLGSQGLENFEDMEMRGKDWEETLLRLSKASDPATNKLTEGGDYEVKVPEVPKDHAEKRDAEGKLIRGMFPSDMNLKNTSYMLKWNSKDS